MKRSKSLPALKSFFTKNDFNAGKLPALKSFFAKNRFIAGKDFERFMWFARMRVSGNRYEFELMSRRIKFSLKSFLWLPVLEKCRFCFRENDFFRGALNCDPLQQIRMPPNRLFDQNSNFQNTLFYIKIN